MGRILFTYKRGCHWDTEFDHVDESNYGQLAVDELKAYDPDASTPTEITLEGYVIDWYLDNKGDGVQFTSGYGVAESYYQVLHPFYDAGDRINKEAGTWIPQIRFVVVDGKKYFAKGVEFCDLDTITVTIRTCDNGVTGDYSHVIDYDAYNPGGESMDQEIELYLDDDGSIRFVPFKFIGQAISDELIVFYISPYHGTETLINRFATGFDLPSGYHQVVDHNGNLTWQFAYPQSSNKTLQRIQQVLDLDGFTHKPGDYLLFQVEGNYLGTSPNTIWELSLKCFTAVEYSDCNPIDNSFNDPSNFAITENPVTCNLEVSFDVGVVPSFTHDFFKYNLWGGITPLSGRISGCSDSFTDNFGQLCLSKSWRIGYTAQGGIRTCENLNDEMTYSKSGTTITFTFNHADDYDLYRLSLIAMLAMSHWTDYDSDIHASEHYKSALYWYNWRIDTSPDSCGGDPVTYIQMGDVPYDPDISLLIIDVAPTADWVAGDIITGQSSGETSEIVSKIDAKVYEIKDLTGDYTDGEIIGVTGVANKLADQGAGFPIATGGMDFSFNDGAKTITIEYADVIEVLKTDVDPATDWVAGDIITGQASGITSEMVSKLDTNIWKVKNVSSIAGYTNGEIIGVTGNANKLADQGTGFPTLEAEYNYDGSIACDSAVKSGINSWVLGQRGKRIAEYSHDTYSGLDVPFGVRYPAFTYAAENDKTFYHYIRVFADMVGDACPQTSPEWCEVTNLHGKQWIFHKYYMRVVIDNPADPLNNYTVYTKLNATTGCIDSTWTCIHKVAGGVPGC